MRSILFSSIVFLLTHLPLQSVLHPPPCKFAFEGDLLYLYPAVEQSAFVIIAESPNSRLVVGDRKSLHPNFHPGVRVRGFYGVDKCWDLSADFVFYRNKDSRSFTSGAIPLYPTIIGDDGLTNSIAEAQVKFKYYGGEIALGYFLSRGCPYELVILGGIHSCSVNCRNNYFFRGMTTQGALFNQFNVETQSRFWGIGPEIGLDFDYTPTTFLWGLSFEGSLRGSLLISEMQTDFSGEQTFIDSIRQTIVQNDPSWHVNPTFQTSLGLNYKWCLCCFQTTIAAGYNMFWYYNAANSIEFEDFFNTGQSRDFYQNFILHGPYVSLQVQF